MKPNEMIATRTGEEFEGLVVEFVSSAMKSLEFCRTLRPRPNTTFIALAFWLPFFLQLREVASPLAFGLSSSDSQLMGCCSRRKRIYTQRGYCPD
jgi:hypothetical protein